MKELIDNIKNILDKYAPFIEKQYDGTYKGKFYVDYTDELDKKTIIGILNSKHPLDAFYDTMSDFYIDDIYEYDSVLKLIEENWNLDEFPIDFIKDWVYENVWFEVPYSHYLNKTVNVDIIVDTGDGNYDFTLNNFASYNAATNEQIHKNSSILWLVKQQGYSKKQLYDAIRHHRFMNSAFLKSVYGELINVTSHMNALAFFVKMTLDDVINYLESPKDIVISEDASCGLYDCWNGAGSLLEIVLEKPVVIPKEYVQMNIDGGRGYGIYEIYGLCDDFWNGTVTILKQYQIK